MKRGHQRSQIVEVGRRYRREKVPESLINEYSRINGRSDSNGGREEEGEEGRGRDRKG
ncbi:MAG: hypothetical protein METHAR1v1_580009 [Methanothrix sp.]|nr:MAG: hypothetical protein METHAR1v1_580009 [Methanothrix sp.]